jgi:sugar lactone lactonase YvrE
MKILLPFLSLMILVTSCNPKKEVSSRDFKNYKAQTAFTVDEKDLIPEGITYDPQTKQFFLSSINKEKIIVVDQNGKHSDFIQSGQDGMLQCLGLKVDLKRRRLWAVSNDVGESCVHIYNIDSGELIKKHSLTDEVRHMFNDLVITDDGGVYITDWNGSSLYFVPPRLNELQLFAAFDSLLPNPNGICISPDNSMLYLASHYKGIYTVDIESKSFAPIENWLQADTRGVDGMMLYNNSLVCIRSGDEDKSKHHITRYWLGEGGKEIVSAEIIDHKNKMFDDPTTGVIVDNYLYCLAVTSLGALGKNETEQKELLKNPVVLKYKLD